MIPVITTFVKLKFAQPYMYLRKNFNIVFSTEYRKYLMIYKETSKLFTNSVRMGPEYSKNIQQPWIYLNNILY